MIRRTVQVKPKHGEKLSGDWRVSKQDFPTSKKLLHRLSHEMESTGRVSWHGRPISSRRSKRYNNFTFVWCVSKLVYKDSHLDFWLFIYLLPIALVSNTYGFPVLLQLLNQGIQLCKSCGTWLGIILFIGDMSANGLSNDKRNWHSNKRKIMLCLFDVSGSLVTEILTLTDYSYLRSQTLSRPG